MSRLQGELSGIERRQVHRLVRVAGQLARAEFRRDGRVCASAYLLIRRNRITGARLSEPAIYTLASDGHEQLVRQARALAARLDAVAVAFVSQRRAGDTELLRIDVEHGSGRRWSHTAVVGDDGSLATFESRTPPAGPPAVLGTDATQDGRTPRRSRMRIRSVDADGEDDVSSEGSGSES